MKQFMVSLNLVSDKAIKEENLHEIFEHDDYQLTRRDTESDTLWRIESFMDDSEPLLCQIKAILSIVSSNGISACEGIIREIYIDIGVLYDTYTCSVDFPFDYLKLITDLCPEIGLSITCYPSDDEE